MTEPRTRTVRIRINDPTTKQTTVAADITWDRPDNWRGGYRIQIRRDLELDEENTQNDNRDPTQET
jgi:hypothetical protein